MHFKDRQHQMKGGMKGMAVSGFTRGVTAYQTNVIMYIL